MCGFAGIVAWDDKYHVTRPLLEKMSARIAHRGPDGQGLYLNHEQEATPERPQVGLVHRRLAILDPDPRSNQPFKDEAGRWLVFNGEIYNYRELRQELKSLRPDYQWRTDGDTEVLLLAYAVWGEKCVDHLNGMFAFAVWDEPGQQLFLARDRMGQKPLYVAYVGPTGDKTRDGLPAASWFGRGPRERTGTAIAFASELGSLALVPWMNRQLSPDGLDSYLRWGYVKAPLTIYSGAEQLGPGTSTTCSHALNIGCDYVHRWGSGTTDAEPSTHESAAQEVRVRVLQAVRRQLVTDVPLGCFLSGGIDSSVIAAAMKHSALPGAPICTFSLGFDDPRYDETTYASNVARHLGTQHRTFRMKPNAAEDLPRLAEVFGEPFADSSALPTHYLARETREYVKVSLSGDGGDELFGGYDRYRAMQLGARLRRATSPLPWIIAAPLLRAAAGGHPKTTHTRALRFAASLGLSPSRRYLSYLRLFDESLIDELLDEASGTHTRTKASDNNYLDVLFRALRQGRGQVGAALAVDRITYLPGDLLTKVDRCSMLHALEVRSPFMDHELVHFAAGLSTDQLLRGGPKRMLREAFAADLPAFVFKRKKMGFAVPIGEWFRGELRPMLRDHLFAADSFAQQHFVRKTVERLVDEHESQRVDHSQRLYALLMLELWWRTARS